jgi:hypothetical protein
VKIALLRFEIALKTVMAIARNHGLDIDQLCRQSIGAIIGDSAMTWVNADHARDAIAEIEIAQADHCAPAAVFDAIAEGAAEV